MGRLSELANAVPLRPVGYATAALSAMGGLYLLRQWFLGGKCYSEARLDGKTVVITGANDGIGKYTAYDMARRGARVIMCCRDMAKAQTAAQEVRQETGNGNVIVKKLDLASLKSVRACADDIVQTESRIDILINNAGVILCPQWETEDKFEMHFGVNHLGHFLFTLLLLARIKESSPSRIVNVSSIAHGFYKLDFGDLMCKKKYSSIAAYGRSKLANILFTRELAARLKGSGVTAYALHPGSIPTSQGKKLSLWIRISLLVLTGFFLKSISQGAQTTIYCAVQPGIENLSGMYFSDCKVKTPSVAAQDDNAAKQLWEVSEKLVGLRQ